MTKQTCDHEWVYDERGYAHCAKCGCASFRGQCVVCKKHLVISWILISPRNGPIKLCSKKCIQTHLKSVRQEQLGSEMK